MLTADSVCQRCGGERSEKIDCFVIHASPTLKSGSKHAVQQHSDEARGGWNPELGAGNDSTPRRDECNQHTRSESGDCARNRDPAVGAGFQVVMRTALLPRVCPISLATVSVAASASAAAAANSQA